MGIIYKNGIEYGVGNFMAVRNLTQVEYDALTTAEKNDGTIYFISDGIPQNQIIDRWGEIGTTYKAAWTATSSSAIRTKVTDSLALPAGVYIITIKTPVMNNNDVPLGLNISSGQDDISCFRSQDMRTFVKTLTTTTTIYVDTAFSTSTTYTYTERGYLKATRIA